MLHCARPDRALDAGRRAIWLSISRHRRSDQQTPRIGDQWLNSDLRMARDNPGVRDRIDTLARLISTEEPDNATVRTLES
jgi:hypothetical protein